jgi:hypothetical protein
MNPLLNSIVDSQPYGLIFVTISGAHLYGFPSPDSDYDLRAVHVLPAREVVGLTTGQETIEVSGDRGGIELDLVSHDAKKFFELMLKKNGYVLEQLYFPPDFEDDAGAPGAQMLGPVVHHQAPRPSLFRICPDPVEIVRKGDAQAREAVALRVSSPAYRHSSHAEWPSRSEFALPERGLSTAIRVRAGQPETRRPGAVDLG